MMEYKYKGARSLILLHEKHLVSCVNTWSETKKACLILPVTDDKDYESLDTLLRHILRSARNYMIWICAKLNLPDPEIEIQPEPVQIEVKANDYVSHLIEKWGLPLSEIPEDKFHSPVFTSNWGVEYCIDAMLEHAVMHPIRHEFQLKNLLVNQIIT